MNALISLILFLARKRIRLAALRFCFPSLGLGVGRRLLRLLLGVRIGSRSSKLLSRLQLKLLRLQLETLRSVRMHNGRLSGPLHHHHSAVDEEEGDAEDRPQSPP